MVSSNNFAHYASGILERTATIQMSVTARIPPLVSAFTDTPARLVH